MKSFYVIEYNYPKNMYEYVADENGFRTYDPEKALQFKTIKEAAEKILELDIPDTHIQKMWRG